MPSDLPQYLPNAAPYYAARGPLGCLVLHGFMANPSEVRWLAQGLADAGFTSYAPRLAGHGARPEDMQRMRWQDWVLSALDAYHLLRATCERVAVLGHSMGGLLALLLAQSHPVDALVLAAVPLSQPSERLKWARQIALAKPYYDFPTEAALQTAVRAAQTARGEAPLGRINYSRWYTRALYELYLLIDEGYASLPQVQAPLLLLYARHDATVRLSNLLLARQVARSPQLEMQIIEQGGHIMFQDMGHEQAIAACVDFVRRSLNL